MQTRRGWNVREAVTHQLVPEKMTATAFAGDLYNTIILNLTARMSPGDTLEPRVLATPADP